MGKHNDLRLEAEEIVDAAIVIFLDPDKQYSCAFFETPDDSVEIAQQNKCRRIAAKLALG